MGGVSCLVPVGLDINSGFEVLESLMVHGLNEKVDLTLSVTVLRSHLGLLGWGSSLVCGNDLLGRWSLCGGAGAGGRGISCSVEGLLGSVGCVDISVDAPVGLGVNDGVQLLQLKARCHS